ncbi:MAG: NADase-type glycan-binding domain-containing protein [Nocardioides sp.]
MTDDRLSTESSERSAAPFRPSSRHRGAPTPPWVAWMVVGLGLVLVAAFGGWLVVRDTGSGTAADPATSQESPADEEPAAEPNASSGTEESPPAEEPEEPAAEAVDLTGTATAQVPSTAPSSSDVTGEAVTFDAPNMLDADPATSWRMAGDGTGSELTFTFPAAVTLSTVGAINGWAKTSVDDAGQSFDWYHGNRRVLSAEWVVGTQTFPQNLADTTELQSLEIEPTETTTVILRLVEVSPPGTLNGRDFTALSDVSLVGTAP